MPPAIGLSEHIPIIQQTKNYYKIMEPEAGHDPTISCLQDKCTTNCAIPACVRGFILAVPLMTSALGKASHLPSISLFILCQFVYTPLVKKWHQMPGRTVSVLAKPRDCVQSARAPYSRLWFTLLFLQFDSCALALTRSTEGLSAPLASFNVFLHVIYHLSDFEANEV